jgi:hypothetical protein
MQILDESLFLEYLPFPQFSEPIGGSRMSECMMFIGPTIHILWTLDQTVYHSAAFETRLCHTSVGICNRRLHGTLRN